MSINNFKPLEHKDQYFNAVMSFNNRTTFRIGKFMQEFNNLFQTLLLQVLSEKMQESGLGTPPRGYDWKSGVRAEILEPQSGKWKKGQVRLRVVLEFCPDEPEVEPEKLASESPLDNIRQEIKE